jgi:hypothetical protein
MLVKPRRGVSWGKANRPCCFREVQSCCLCFGSPELYATISKITKYPLCNLIALVPSGREEEGIIRFSVDNLIRPDAQGN